MSNFSDADQSFTNWLSSLREPEKIRVCIDNRSGTIIAKFTDVVAAHEALAQQERLQKNLGLKVYIGSEPYGSTQYEPKLGRHQSTNSILSMKTKLATQSSWVEQNSNAFQVIPGTVAIHSADKDQGFKFLDVKPDMGIEDRLNKPIAEMIGSPLNIIAEGIAAPRSRHLEIVASNGGSLSYDYDFVWNNLLWRFRVHLAYLHGHDEVLAITEDLESWQRDYWLKLVKQ